MYEVRLQKEAADYFQKSTGKDRELLETALADLERDPTWQNPNVVHLVRGFVGFYRYRKGNHRLIFRIEGQTVYVHTIALRRDSY